MEEFSGSQEDLEGAAENLFSSPPRPQPLRFESLYLKVPQTVQPTPDTALQHKIESRLEKSLGSQFNIQLQQQMGGFSGVHAGRWRLRDEMHSMKKVSKSDVVQNLTLYQKLDPVNSPTPLQLGLQFPRLGHPTTQMPNQWTRTIMDLHFLQSPVRACFQALGS